MYLKCRHTGVFFLIFIVTIPCYCLNYYDAAKKMRVDNIEDYGERLSSIERGHRRGSTNLKDENKGIEKLVGIESNAPEDVAQEEEMSMQENPVVKLQEEKSSSKQEHSKEVDNVSQKEELQDQNTVNPQEKSKGLDPSGKQLKQENDESQPEKEPENVSKLDFTEEHESSKQKQNSDAINSDVETSTKCTTDREVTIGDYKPPEDSHTDGDGNGEGDGEGDVKGDGDGDGGGDGEGDVKGDSEDDSKGDGESEDKRPNVIDDDDEIEKTVSKVYKGPKPAKAPDHYIDDI